MSIRWQITDDLLSEVAKKFESRWTSKIFLSVYVVGGVAVLEETFFLDNEPRGRIAVHTSWLLKTCFSRLFVRGIFFLLYLLHVSM
jgi:hypothetical protein